MWGGGEGGCVPGGGWPAPATSALQQPNPSRPRRAPEHTHTGACTHAHMVRPTWTAGVRRNSSSASSDPRVEACTHTPSPARTQHNKGGGGGVGGRGRGRAPRAPPPASLPPAPAPPVAAAPAPRKKNQEKTNTLTRAVDVCEDVLHIFHHLLLQLLNVIVRARHVQLLRAAWGVGGAGCGRVDGGAGRVGGRAGRGAGARAPRCRRRRARGCVPQSSRPSPRAAPCGAHRCPSHGSPARHAGGGGSSGGQGVGRLGR